jgi:hypothetical protein
VASRGSVKNICGLRTSGSKGSSVNVDIIHAIFIVMAPMPSAPIPKFALPKVTQLATWMAKVKKMAVSKDIRVATWNSRMYSPLLA